MRWTVQKRTLVHLKTKIKRWRYPFAVYADEWKGGRSAPVWLKLIPNSGNTSKSDPAESAFKERPFCYLKVSLSLQHSHHNLCTNYEYVFRFCSVCTCRLMLVMSTRILKKVLNEIFSVIWLNFGTMFSLVTELIKFCVRL